MTREELAAALQGHVKASAGLVTRFKHSWLTFVVIRDTAKEPMKHRRSRPSSTGTHHADGAALYDSFTADA